MWQNVAFIIIIESMYTSFGSRSVSGLCCVSLNQMFIGHSQSIHQVSFTPDQLGIVSVGDAIFLWDFLADTADSLTDSR